MEKGKKKRRGVKSTKEKKGDVGKKKKEKGRGWRSRRCAVRRPQTNPSRGTPLGPSSVLCSSSLLSLTLALVTRDRGTTTEIVTYRLTK